MPGEKTKPQAYEGDLPYIFVSYAHADGAAMPIIRALVDEGYRVWYDDGIQTGSSFPDYIADRLHDCSCMLMLVSRSWLGSAWCRNEVEYALDLGRPVLPVYLEDVELPRALHLRLGSVQALYWYAYATDDEFNARLFAVKMLDPFLSFDAKKRKGVQLRDVLPAVTKPASVSMGARDHINANLVEYSDTNNLCAVSPGVVPKDTLNEYSWAELKMLSRAIAAATSDAEGLVLAQQFHLVDDKGKLQNNKKTVVLDKQVEAEVRVLGFRHDSMESGELCGITFEFAGIPKMHAMNLTWTNEGGWKKCDLRRWLNNDFLAYLPEDLLRHLEVTKKRTNNTSKTTFTSDTLPVTITYDKIWLLSQNEVYGSNMGVYRNEGAQYQLYTDQDVSIASYGFCSKSTESWWWLRSPHVSFTYSFLVVDHDGGCHGEDADCAYGVSPGFCI